MSYLCTRFVVDAACSLRKFYPFPGSPTQTNEVFVMGRAEARVAFIAPSAIRATALPNASGIGGIGRRARLRIWFLTE